MNEVKERDNIEKGMSLHDALIHKVMDDFTKAGIKHPVKFLLSKQAQTFGFLKGAFPRNGLPTDGDGIVNIGMKFLLFEVKPQRMLRQGDVSKGQMIAFRRLVETGMWTVYWLGQDERLNYTLMHIWTHKATRVIDPCNSEMIYNQSKRWSAWALKEEDAWDKLTFRGSKPHCPCCYREYDKEYVPVRYHFPPAATPAASPEGASGLQPFSPDGA